MIKTWTMIYFGNAKWCIEISIDILIIYERGFAQFHPSYQYLNLERPATAQVLIETICDTVFWQI